MINTITKTQEIIMKLSKRITEMEASPIRKLTPYADQAQANGLHVIHLNIGQPDIKTPPEFFDAIKSFSDPVLAYGDSRGSKDLIETLIEYYNKLGIHYEHDDIIITNGGSEGVTFAITAVCNKGDQILTPEPFYSNYSNFAESLDVEMVPITTYARDGFALPDKSEFEKRITDKTKAIIISNPGNPTGRVFTQSEIDLIKDLALEHDLFIISDEVYKEFIYNDEEFRSFAQIKELEQHTILIDSISKRYSCCGARIGSISSKNKDVIFNVLKLAQSRLCVSTLDQVGAANLRNVTSEYMESVRIEYKKRRDLIFDRVSTMEGVVARKPDGAFYYLLNLPVDDAEKFTIWILENVNIDNNTILITPAESFYITEGLGRNEIRISYCINEEKLSKAMDILEYALKIYPGRTI